MAVRCEQEGLRTRGRGSAPPANIDLNPVAGRVYRDSLVDPYPSLPPRRLAFEYTFPLPTRCDVLAVCSIVADVSTNPEHCSRRYDRRYIRDRFMNGKSDLFGAVN